MKKFLSILAVTAMIFSCFCFFCQAGQKAFAAETVDLGKYLAMVKEGNFDLRSALSSVEAAYYEVLASVAPQRPSVGISGTAAHSNAMSGNEGTYSASLYLTQRIDISGINTLSEQQQILGYESTRANFDGGVNNLLSLAETEYWSAVLARENVALQEDVLRQRRENNRVTEEKYRQQLVPRLDIIRSEAQVVAAEALVVQAGAQYRNRLASMAALTGGTEVVPAEDPLLVPELNVSASFEKALAYRPDIRGANLNLERAKAAKKLAAKGMSPTLNGRIEWTPWTDPWSPASTAPDHQEIGASLNLNIPISDGNGTKYSVMNADKLIQAAESAVHSAENTTRMELAVAVNNWEMAEALEKARKRQVERSDEELRITELMYNEGMGAQIDLINAQTENQQVRTEYLDSIRGMYTALVDLRKAVGDYAPNEDGTWREAVVKYGKGQKVKQAK